MSGEQAQQFVFTGVTIGAIYAIVALGFTIIYNVSGLINFAQGEFVALGALLVHSFSALLPMAAAVGLAVLATVALGLGLEFVAIRRTRGGLASLTIVTLGASLALRGAADLVWGKDARPVPAFSSAPQSLWVLGSAGLAMVALYVFFNRTMLGRAVIACGLNRYGATVIGVDPRRMRLLAFGLSAALGALAGALIAPITLASPGLGVLGVKGFAAAALGGLGSAPGAIIGGLALGVMESLGSGLIASQYKEVIAYGVLLVVLLARPHRMAEPPTAIAEAPSAGRSLPGSGVMRAGMPALVVLVLCVPLLGNGYLTSVGVQVGLYALVGLGLGLMLGWSGQVSLGHAAFMGVGAYATAIFTVEHRWPPVVALVCGTGVTAVIAAGIGWQLRKLGGHYLALGTLAVGSIASEVFKHADGVTNGVAGIRDVPRISVGELTLYDNAQQYVVIWLLVILFGIGLLNLMRSRIGRALRAVASSDTAAESLGVGAAGLRIKVFVLSAIGASIAGSLYAHVVGYIDPAPFGFDASLRLVVLAVVGGSASVLGAPLGAVVVVGLSQVLQQASDWNTLANGALLILIAARLPRGVAGVLHRSRA